MNNLELGGPAPSFTALDQHGASHSLEDFAGRSVLLYFYPRALTSGCTTQACGLRDIAGEVGDTAIIGVSPDQPEKLLRFDEKHDLGFVLLSDPDHVIAEAYGAWGEKKARGKTSVGIIRSACLIDENGALSHIWPKSSPKETPIALLEALNG